MNRNSAKKPAYRIDPIIEGGAQANDPIYHSPNSDFKPWNNQPEFSPKKREFVQVAESQVFPVTAVTTQTKNGGPISEFNPYIQGKNNGSPPPVTAVSTLIQDPSPTPNWPQQQPPQRYETFN